jgi:hypothetical protein
VGGGGEGVGNGGGGGIGRWRLGNRWATSRQRLSRDPTRRPPKYAPGARSPLESSIARQKKRVLQELCQVRVEGSTGSGYAPSRYSRTPSVKNRTAAPTAEGVDKSGEGWNPARTSGSLVEMRRIRAMPGGASKYAGPWRGLPSGRWNPRSLERRLARLDARWVSGVSGYTSGNKRTKSWSYRSDQATPKPMRLSQNKTRSICNYSAN